MISEGDVLSGRFFVETPTLELAQKLLGCILWTQNPEGLTAGKIVETEAYCAPEDKASHAWNYRRTARTETMYQTGGTIYIYLCYGIHHLFNVVCGSENLQHAVLIRAVEPVFGLDLMLKRRKLSSVCKKLTGGPGMLAQALAIDGSFNGLLLARNNKLWIECPEKTIPQTNINAAKRIGIDYSGKWKDKLWRYYITDSNWVSKK